MPVNRPENRQAEQDCQQAHDCARNRYRDIEPTNSFKPFCIHICRVNKNWNAFRPLRPNTIPPQAPKIKPLTRQT